MGTHGRNAITKNGYHECCEQPMDGHYAADDLTSPFLEEGRIPDITQPTMECRTSECDHIFFAHIDYDTKTLYTSWLDPEKAIAMTNEQVLMEYGFSEEDIPNFRQFWKKYIENMNKLREQGWSFVFDTIDCPKDTFCVNSPNYDEQLVGKNLYKSLKSAPYNGNLFDLQPGQMGIIHDVRLVFVKYIPGTKDGELFILDRNNPGYFRGHFKKHLDNYECIVLIPEEQEEVEVALFKHGWNFKDVFKEPEYEEDSE